MEKANSCRLWKCCSRNEPSGVGKQPKGLQRRATSLRWGRRDMPHEPKSLRNKPAGECRAEGQHSRQREQKVRCLEAGENQARRRRNQQEGRARLTQKPDPQLEDEWCRSREVLLRQGRGQQAPGDKHYTPGALNR